MRLGDAGLERLRAAHLRVSVVVGIEVVVSAHGPAEEPDGVESVALGDVAELWYVGVGPHQLLVLLLHDDEQPPREAARPVRRGGPHRLVRGVEPGAVALRRGVPVAVNLLEHRLGERPLVARADGHRMAEAHVGFLRAVVPPDADALEALLGIMHGRIPCAVSRVDRDPRHRKVARGIGACLEVHDLVGLLLPRFELLLVGREVVEAASEPGGDVDVRLGGVEGDRVEPRPVELRHAHALVVVLHDARIGFPGRRVAHVDDHLHVERLAAARKRAIHEPAVIPAALLRSALHRKRRLLALDLDLHVPEHLFRGIDNLHIVELRVLDALEHLLRRRPFRRGECHPRRHRDDCHDCLFHCLLSCGISLRVIALMSSMAISLASEWKP